MNPKLKFICNVAEGGTILGFSKDPKGRLWAATSVGLFQQDDQGWLPMQGNPPFPQVSTITRARKQFFAGSTAGGIAYSLDGGITWHQAWVDQVQSPVACFTLSPNYLKDHVLLAGTMGEGILRTTDGGRHWQLENFGLQGFYIFDLESVGVKNSFREMNYVRDYVFAGTDDGVYWSPNGGRAWKRAGSETAGVVILTVSVSPRFNQDRTLYAGSETGEIYRSSTGGESWEKLDLGAITPGAINSLISMEEGALLAGTSNAGILGSMDKGNNWQQFLEDVAPVLSLEWSDDEIYAGFFQRGMMKSCDGGTTWRNVENLTARRFEWLEITSTGRFLAAGPEDGMWMSDGNEGGWPQLSSWMEGNVILGMLAKDELILAFSADGLWRSTNGGAEWTQTLSAEEILPDGGVLTGRFYFASNHDQVWFGGENREIWFSDDGGENWQPVAIPFTGMPIIGIGAPKKREDIRLVAGVFAVDSNQVSIWRMSRDGSWTQWACEETSWVTLNFDFSDDANQFAVLGLGTQMLEENLDGELEVVLNLENDPITALTVSSNGKIVVAATLNRIHFRTGMDAWKSVPFNHSGDPVVGLQFFPGDEKDQHLFLLTSTGKLWKLQMED